MKQLFWKECYELRFLPLGAALAVAVLMAGIKAYTHWYGPSFPSNETMLPVLICVWLLFAALVGSGTVSQEIGTGTLQFLSSLPVSRRTLWWVKVGAALGMLLPSLLTSTLTWLLLCALWCIDRLSPTPGWLLPSLALTLLFLFNVFAIALAVSPFFDRSLSAFVASILICVAVVGLFQNIVYAHNIGPRSDHLFFTVIGLCVPAFAVVSYWTFTRGETLRGRKRFIVAGITGGVCVGISLVILATASAFGAW